MVLSFGLFGNRVNTIPHFTPPYKMSGFVDKLRELDVVCVVTIALVIRLSPIMYFEMNIHDRLDR